MPGYSNFTISANDWERKAARSEEPHQLKIKDLIQKREQLVSNASNLKKGTPEYDETFNALREVDTNLREAYNPQTHPNAIRDFGHLLTDHLKITNPQKRVEKEGAKRAQGLAGDERQAQLDVAAGPLSPTQTAIGTANSNAAGNLASIQASIRNFDTLNPNATPEERNSFRSTLVQRSLLGQEKPTLKLYTLPDGTKAWLDATRPDLIPPGSTAAVTETGDTRKRADFEAFKQDNPEYKGTFEEWIATQAATGRGKAPKPETLDNAYKAILVKEQSGQPLTADEKAHKAAWQIYNRETKIDPGVARAAAFGAMRYIPVVDPTNPEKVVMMRAGDAARSGVGTPASIAFKTDAAITKYMTSGQGGVNINYFNTATYHLEILRQAGEALNNGDYPAFNGLANRFATATGAPAPTNFDSVKSAVAGELSKTFKGTGATDQEIAEINTTINNAQSPQQITGAINFYTRLMGSKLDALKGQYTAGKSGQPNFPGSTPSNAPKNPQAIKNEANKLQYPKAPDIGTVEDGDSGKHRYKGGDPAKKESWEKVSK